MSRTPRNARASWRRHDRAFRQASEVAAQWRHPGLSPGALTCEADTGFWDALAATGSTLLVTREYEHLLLAVAVVRGRPRISYMVVPHPNGLAVRADGGAVYVASTRNPNMVIEFTGRSAPAGRRLLLPHRAWYYPGALYIHDLAFVGRSLYANAVGLDAVVSLPAGGGYSIAWQPRVVGEADRPARNYLQLNSIAAGRTLRDSFFTASAERPGRYRPGHLRFPVDRRGVVFSGRTREPIARGLTRPHSARLHRGELWVDNSGYGQVGRIESGRFEVVASLPGWTRGLCFAGGVAFVATSRVLPRYAAYAPGLSVRSSVAGVHAVDARTGRRLGSLRWPSGNQLFALELVAGHVEWPFPSTPASEIELFYRGKPQS